MKIINETPWNTNDLTNLLTPLCERLEGITTIKVRTLQAQPGVKREDQTPFCVGPEGGHYYYNGSTMDTVVVSLLSPRRAGAATEMLDRLSLVESLQPHEAALSSSAIAGIEHGMEAFRAHHRKKAADPASASWEYMNCMRGDCTHKYSVSRPVLVRGDTKAKIKPAVSVKDLERKLEWAGREVQQAQEDLAEATAKRDKIQARIDRLKAKDAG